jgi:XRE family transcriptional regulator, regulator of sulfur utilization
VSLGERIKWARRERGLSLSALARLVGLSKGFLSQIEAGQSSPSLSSLQKLADGLDLPIASLIDKEAPTPTRVPRVIRARRVRAPGQLLSPALDFGASQGILLTIARGQHVVGALDDVADSEASCLVVAGHLELTLDGHAQQLSVGEMLAFGQASHYTVLCSSQETTLLLIVPDGSEMPRIETAQVHPAPRPLLEVAGPFKLVEMRAARRDARRSPP